MFRFLETDIRKQKYCFAKHCFSFSNKNIFYFWRHFFKIPKNLITSAFFFAEADTKNIDVPRQKSQMLHW